MRYITLIFLFIFISSCESSYDSTEIIETARSISNSGNVAYVTETSSETGVVTQVTVEFSDGRCGAGAVHVYDINLGLSISWLSDNLVEISHPSNVEPILNASGSKLQCNSEFINIKLKALNKKVNNLQQSWLDATSVAPVT